MWRVLWGRGGYVVVMVSVMGSCVGNNGNGGRLAVMVLGRLWVTCIREIDEGAINGVAWG